MNKVNSDNKEFLTSDTPLATYLIQEGLTLLIIQYEEKINGKQRATFVFENCPKLQERVTFYNTGTATINIALYEHTKSGLIYRIMRGLP